jgi:DNA-directed RNA polymerase subunit N (RpoN/RPB10)
MIYAKCPTCRFDLSKIQVEFEIKFQKICQDLSIDENEYKEAIGDLLDSLEIKKICCRPRVLCYIKKTDLIK